MEQHKAIFIGSVVRKMYHVRWGHELREYYQTIEEKEICTVDLDNPPLKSGDYIFINDLKKKVCVEEVLRSTNNELIYYTNHHFEIIEDEITLKSKEKAERELKEIEENYLKEKLAKEEQDKLKNKKWYQFWK